MILKENRNYPYEGYFWIINNEIVGITGEDFDSCLQTFFN